MPCYRRGVEQRYQTLPRSIYLLLFLFYVPLDWGGPYIGQMHSKPVLRVNERLADRILTSYLQEGAPSMEPVVRNRSWKRNLNGEPYQSEAEALTLDIIIHITLMVYRTVQKAFNSASWLGTALRRLYAIFYVEKHTTSRPRHTLWGIDSKIHEIYPDLNARTPSIEKTILQGRTDPAKSNRSHNAHQPLFPLCQYNRYLTAVRKPRNVSVHAFKNCFSALGLEPR